MKPISGNFPFQDSRNIFGKASGILLVISIFTILLVFIIPGCSNDKNSHSPLILPQTGAIITS